MLSINRRTSCPLSSLKYSAIVRPVKATLIRAPGGSFICPKASAVFSKTPDSFISKNRSLPSLVLSPTPAKTERPPCSWAMLLISSVIKTVLPTPAPPNNPTLEPFEKGNSKSITLIPVSNSSIDNACSEYVGDILCIGINFSGLISPNPSIGSPVTFTILPNNCSPTGTVIGAPVATTSAPLTNPSVVPIAIVLTIESPISAATSKTSIPPSNLTVNASLIAGNFILSNLTSTTGPIIFDIFPIFFDIIVLLLPIHIFVFKIDKFYNPNYLFLQTSLFQ